MSNINAQSIRAKDLNDAYDLLAIEFSANPDLVESGKTEIETILVRIERKLTEIGYQRAAQTGTILKTHQSALAKGTKQAVDADTASDNARLIVGEILAKTFPPRKHPLAGEAASPEEKAPAVPAAPVESDTGRVSIGNVTVDANASANINSLLREATGREDIEIERLLNTIEETRAKIAEIEMITEQAGRKIDAYRAKDADAGDAINIAAVHYRPSGLGETSLNERLAGPLDSLLKIGTKNDSITLRAILDEISGLESKADAAATGLRQKIREAQAARPTAAPAYVAGESNEPEVSYDFQIVMKNAAEVFTNAFGGTSELLDFDVPTLVFDKPHPDVPEINPSFRFYSPILADGLDCINDNHIPWYYGDSGCGKSEFVDQLAARLNFPLYRLNMDSHLSRGDLVGMNRLVRGAGGGTEMRFIEGLVPRAIKTPSILLIDEMDLGDPEIMPVLQPVLEGKGIRLLEDGGRYVRPHPFSRIFATANTIGLGSPDMTYLNVHEQSAAMRDRISRYIEMPYLPADMEVEVVMERIPHADRPFVQNVVKLANHMRDARRKNNASQVISTRSVINAASRHANYVKRYPEPKLAERTTIEAVLLNRCDPASRSVMTGFIDSIFAWR